MKITLTGSLGNISKPLAVSLIANGHDVTIITSSAHRSADIRALGAKAAIGSVEDEAFLTSAFKGADVVYTMVPPNFAATDFRKYASGTGQKYANALAAAGVKRVVNLSSIGGHLAEGTGPIKGLHDTEQALNALEGVAVKHLRPGFFYVNFFGNIGMISDMNILGSNYSADTMMVMVHPDDIAKAAAEEIQGSFTGSSVRYVSSDERTAGEVAKVLGAAVGKPELPWVEFTDQQALEGMMQGGLPEEMAKNYVEMGDAVRTGKLWEDYTQHKQDNSKAVKLEQFAAEFAKAYKAAAKG